MSLLKGTSQALVLQYKGYLKNLSSNYKKAMEDAQNYDYDIGDAFHYRFESLMDSIQYDIDEIYKNFNNYKRGV